MGTIPNVCKIGYLKYSPRFSVVCSIGRAPFHGYMEIEYRPDRMLLEFESFEDWLRSIALQEFTIESLTRVLFDELRGVLGDIPLRVTIHAETTVHAPVSAQIQQGEWGK